MFAIIGGSGLAKLVRARDAAAPRHAHAIRRASGALTFGSMAAGVVFLARHGYGHTIAPHEVNYRANMWALKARRCDGVVAVATVGGIAPKLGPGALALPRPDHRLHLGPRAARTSRAPARR